MQELRGMPVVNALIEQITTQIEKLNENQIIPKLAVIRIGEREDDIAYEKGILKRFSSVNAAVDVINLPLDVTQNILEETMINNMVDGKLCGDVDYEAVAQNVAAITPVPGGVGTVTTSVLLKNTVNSAMKMLNCM